MNQTLKDVIGFYNKNIRKNNPIMEKPVKSIKLRIDTSLAIIMLMVGGTVIFSNITSTDGWVWASVCLLIVGYLFLRFVISMRNGEEKIVIPILFFAVLRRYRAWRLYRRTAREVFERDINNKNLWRNRIHLYAKFKKAGAYEYFRWAQENIYMDWKCSVFMSRKLLISEIEKWNGETVERLRTGFDRAIEYVRNFKN